MNDKGKKVVILGVSGGIACYRVPEIISILRDEFEFFVVMTAAATEFITPLTFKIISGNPVTLDLFDDTSEKVDHVALADVADLFVVAPATANAIAKFAHGIADDALSTYHLSLDVPRLLCPSMNHRMLNHAATKANLKTLESRGYHIMPPVSGHLACGHVAMGRLPEPADIAAKIRELLS
ncbi:MAG: hypothetical protein NUW37_02985 [Planctomycetes bacterium]|nr:hypothetical protein [Planctomycetota bacterium]